MAKEIERKFLVKGTDFKDLGNWTLYRQGYLSTDENAVVRVRVSGQKAYITVKGMNIGASRDEFEYEIPLSEANQMIEFLCKKPIIEKNRYVINYKGSIWEVDEFLGKNSGLVVAEIELESESDKFEKPEWIGEEVTGDQRYYNSNLISSPFIEW